MSPIADEKLAAANYELICKSWFDGFRSHSAYKQIFHEISNAYDENIICTLLVPLRLRNKVHNHDTWLNPKPSSSRFCRPIVLQRKKEIKEIAVTEEKKILVKIEN